ncbi:MAG TPA: tail fiber protein [Anaerolineales bacterium]
MESFIGSIILFAGNFAPRDWAFCQGQLLSIAQNTALFSILGTTYGGNGQTTFALPDLRGRAPIGVGQGPGLSNITLGEQSGSENVTLLATNMPPHTHDYIPAASQAGSSDSPVGLVPATDPNRSNIYGSPDGTRMAPGTTGIAGGGQPVSIQNPFLGLDCIICLEGIFPSRN